MFNQYLTDTCWYLHDYSLINQSFSNAKLILTFVNPNQYLPILTVTYQYLVNV